MGPNIDIHIIPTCPYCIRAIEWLDQWGLEYQKIPHIDPLEKRRFYEEHKVRTLPQLFVNGKRIGGWTDLCASDFKSKVEAGEDVSCY